MHPGGITALGVAVLGAVLAAQTTTPQTATQTPRPARPPLAVAHKAPAPAQAAAPQPDVVKQYCVGCHSEKGKAGGLSLVSYDATHPEQDAETSERMIRKLRAGMMPPPGARRPDGAVLTAFATSLESKVDAAAVLKPNPG